MESAVAVALTALLGYGVPGLAFLGLLYIIVYQARRENQYQSEIRDLYKVIQEKQAKHAEEVAKLKDERIADARLYAEALSQTNQDWSDLKSHLEQFLERIAARRRP